MLRKLPDAVGHALQGRRAGLEKILFNRIDLRTGVAQLEVTSLAFADHTPIPMQYTADGEGLSPPLAWRGVPPNAGSLALIVEDADSPTAEPLVHAIAVDIEPARSSLGDGELRSDAESVHLGRNSSLRHGWLPPDPPPGHGVHRYAFQLFALAQGEPLPESLGRDALAGIIRERGLASGCLIGTYERDNTVKVKDDAAVVSAAATPAVPP